MNLTSYIARSMNGRQEINTLDIREDWELVEILVDEEEPEPVAWIDGGEVEEDDDWELVEIIMPDEESE